MLKTKEELINEWREEFGYDEESDEEIWNDITNISHLYGDLDEKWYNILNCKFKETYNCWFIDEKILKTQVDNAKMNTCKVNDMLHVMARRVHNGLKHPEHGIKWLEVIDMTEECFFGQQNY